MMVFGLLTNIPHQMSRKKVPVFMIEDVMVHKEGYLLA